MYCFGVDVFRAAGVAASSSVVGAFEAPPAPSVKLNCRCANIAVGGNEQRRSGAARADR